MDFKLVSKLSAHTSRGMLSKAWYTDGKYTYLVKGCSIDKNGNIGYEPFSEVLASIIAKNLGINHVGYSILNSSKFSEIKDFGLGYVSICKELPNNYYCERLSALKVMELYYGREISTNYWKLYNNMIVNKNELIEMLIFDSIIGNEDRHLNNWELYIDNKGNMTQTPLFDNGASCLAWIPDNKLNIDFKIGRDVSKPFKDTHTKQIALLKKTYPDFRINLNINQLDIIWSNIDIEIQPILKLMNDKRANCIRKYIHNRLYHYLKFFIKEV